MKEGKKERRKGESQCKIERKEQGIEFKRKDLVLNEKNKKEILNANSKVSWTCWLCFSQVNKEKQEEETLHVLSKRKCTERRQLAIISGGKLDVLKTHEKLKSKV